MRDAFNIGRIILDCLGVAALLAFIFAFSAPWLAI